MNKTYHHIVVSPVVRLWRDMWLVCMCGRHDSSVCMQDMTDSYGDMTRGAAMARYVTGLYVCETWLVRVYARHASFIWWHDTWRGYGEMYDFFVCMRDMTRPYVCKTCLIHKVTWHVARLLQNMWLVCMYVRHDSCVCMQDMTDSYGDMTHCAAIARCATGLYVVRHDSCVSSRYARHDSFRSWHDPWRGYCRTYDSSMRKRDVTRACMCGIWVIHIVTWRVICDLFECMCYTNQSYMSCLAIDIQTSHICPYKPVIYVLSRNTRDMWLVWMYVTRSYDSCVCMQDMTDSYGDMTRGAAIARYDIYDWFVCMWDMTRACVCKTWLIHMVTWPVARLLQDIWLIYT